MTSSARTGSGPATSSSRWASSGPALQRLFAGPKVLLEIDRMNLAGHVEEFGRTRGGTARTHPHLRQDRLALVAETR